MRALTLYTHCLHGVILLIVLALQACQGKPTEPLEQPISLELPTVFPSETPTLIRTETSVPTETPVYTPTFTPNPEAPPGGKIVYSCQVFKDNDRNQICLINADGTNPRQLTTDPRANHFYPSLAPDGMSIVFSSNQTGTHEIYEMDLAGNQMQLTAMGELYAPEISPDGMSIVFTNAGGRNSAIWIMNRDGSVPQELYGRSGMDALDPTWSPDGNQILFAMGSSIETKNLYVIGRDGTGLRAVNDHFSTRGRSDWSWSGELLAGYSGGPWQRKIYLMRSDGSELTELYSSGNVQAPSFSPDDQWVVFTGYIDHMRDDNGCELYTLGINNGMLQRLTFNDFCDWQPRWGP